jgi:hypothetical protein
MRALAALQKAAGVAKSIFFAASAYIENGRVAS